MIMETMVKHKVELMLFVDNLNNYFSGTGFTFAYSRCETRWVNDSDLFRNSDRCDFFYLNDHNDGVDVHLISDTGPRVGVACSIPGAEILVGGTKYPGTTWELSAVLGSTPAHEIGHCLGLFHTHRGGLCGGGYTDCDNIPLASVSDPSAGDYVSDTSYDPRGQVTPATNCLYNYSNISCEPIDTGFNPLADNIMSAYHDNCRSAFTDCQAVRMHELMPLGLDGEIPQELCCGDYILPDGSSVQDLVNLMGVPTAADLENLQAEVYVEGVFNVDERLILAKDLNFYFAANARIIVGDGILFRKIGGFLTACDNKWHGIKSENSELYLHQVNVSEAWLGLNFQGGTGTITYCDILNCQIGISMSYADNVWITNNSINTLGNPIVADNFSSYVAAENEIGFAFPVEIGINNVTAFGLIDNNKIRSTYSSIESLEGGCEILNNDIQNDNDIGIYSYFSNDIISDNIIHGEGESGITSNSLIDGDINNNRVDGNYQNGIELLRSDDVGIYNNQVLSGDEAGIRVDNSSFNLFECNDIESSDIGLDIISNSLFQEIRTNHFSGNSKDFFANSDFGIQYIDENSGNLNWESAELQQFSSDFAHFQVSDITDYGGIVPLQNEWAPNDLYRPFPGDGISCGSAKGPRHGIPFGDICAYIEYLNSKKDDNYRFYFIRVFYLARKYLRGIPQSEWPECLVALLDESSFSPRDIIESEIKVRTHLATTNSAFTHLRNQLDFESDYEEHQQASQAFKSIRIQRSQEFESLISQELLKFSELSSDSDEMFNLYRNGHVYLLKHFNNSIAETDIENIREIAELCASEYGNVVHLAQGLIRIYSDVPFNQIDDCTGVLENRNKTDRPNEFTASIYPNPSSHDIIISHNQDDNTDIIIRDLTGNVIMNSVANKTEYRVDISSYNSGVYIVEIINSAGAKIVSKLIVHN